MYLLPGYGFSIKIVLVRELKGVKFILPSHIFMYHRASYDISWKDQLNAALSAMQIRVQKLVSISKEYESKWEKMREKLMENIAVKD